MKEQEERKKLLFFSLFSRSSWKLWSGSFSASLEGQPRDWLRFEDVYAKLDSCYSVSNLNYCTSELTLNTDANTVWGARKCLLIFVGKKKNLFCLPTVSKGSLGENGSIFFYQLWKKNVTDLHIFVCTVVCVFFLSLAFCFYWLTVTDFDD